MKKAKFTNKELRDKISQGLDLAFKKLIIQKKNNNGVFVFSEDGKIIEVNAKDFKD